MVAWWRWSLVTQDTWLQFMATPATFKCCIPKPRTRENKDRAEVCYESSRLPRAMHTHNSTQAQYNTPAPSQLCSEGGCIGGGQQHGAGEGPRPRAAAARHQQTPSRQPRGVAEPGDCSEHARVRPRHVQQRSVDSVDRILCIGIDV